MKSNRPCTRCGGTTIERFESVRAGGGPLAVGLSARAFGWFSQFEAFVRGSCGYTEFYRKYGEASAPKGHSGRAHASSR